MNLTCTPIAAGHQAEGLCLLLELGAYRVLLDCGLADVTPLVNLKPGHPPVDAVFCSHAHPDHAQGLRSLREHFPQLPIYTSEVTAQLLATGQHPDSSTSACQALPWRSPVEFLPGLTVELWPAGHLPGAAAILLTVELAPKAYTVFFTGDFFLSNSRLVDGLPLDELRGLRPDVLIMEGSYGTARYPHRRQQENHLAEQIHRIVKAGRSVLLWVPPLGLGQELLMLLRSHHHFTGQAIDLWVDEAIALGCDAYLELLPHFPATVQNFARHQALFWDDRIRPHLRRLATVTPNAPLTAPSIVLVEEHTDLRAIAPLIPPPWTLLLPERPGQSAGNDWLARLAPPPRSPTPDPTPWITAQLNRGNLQVETFLLAEHCDSAGTTQLIHNLRPQHVVFVHGSPVYLADLTGLEELQTRYQLHSPPAGQVVELPIGERFIQPAPPETVYDGELTELEGHVLLEFEPNLTLDPRWQRFSETGVVTARWQGEELVVRCVSPTELLQPPADPGRDRRRGDCCQQCQFYRGQTCRNDASPLYQFQVTPDGYCPSFAAKLTNL